jgi:hypothetical protein
LGYEEEPVTHHKGTHIGDKGVQAFYRLRAIIVYYHFKIKTQDPRRNNEGCIACTSANCYDLTTGTQTIVERKTSLDALTHTILNPFKDPLSITWHTHIGRQC